MSAALRDLGVPEWGFFFPLFYFLNCFDLSLSVTDVAEFWPCQLKVNLVCIFYEFMFYKFYITRTCFIGNAYFDFFFWCFFRIFTCMSIASDLIQNNFLSQIEFSWF